MSPATKAAREKLTLRDVMDLLELTNRYIEEHVDEIELNGGALPDDLAAMLDEIDASTVDRVDAIANKLDEFTGYAETAKATKDRAARRQKVWENAAKSLKSYAALQVQRNGGAPLKGAAATLRLQRNGQPSTVHAYTNEQLLEIFASGDPVSGEGAHPLTRYVSVERVATLDTRAIGVAYEARRAQLEEEAALIGPSDILEAVNVDAADVDPTNTVAQEIIAERVDAARAAYVSDNLGTEFPAVTVTRGHHLRID